MYYNIRYESHKSSVVAVAIDKHAAVMQVEDFALNALMSVDREIARQRLEQLQVGQRVTFASESHKIEVTTHTDEAQEYPGLNYFVCNHNSYKRHAGDVPETINAVTTDAEILQYVATGEDLTQAQKDAIQQGVESVLPRQGAQVVFQVGNNTVKVGAWQYEITTLHRWHDARQKAHKQALANPDGPYRGRPDASSVDINYIMRRRFDALPTSINWQQDKVIDQCLPEIVIAMQRADAQMLIYWLGALLMWGMIQRGGVEVGRLAQLTARLRTYIAVTMSKNDPAGRYISLRHTHQWVIAQSSDGRIHPDIEKRLDNLYSNAHTQSEENNE